MRLWLDDCRKPVGQYDLWAKTADEAIEMLQKYEIEHCSLDHDLADEHYKYGLSSCGDAPIPRSALKEKTGYDVLLWIADSGRWPADVQIHTANPTGAKDMMQLCERHAPDTTQYRYVPAYQLCGLEPTEAEPVDDSGNDA